MPPSRSDYWLDLPADAAIESIAGDVYRRSWRFDFDEPGFCLVRLSPTVDSHGLRARMVQLKSALSTLHEHHVGRPFHYRSLARFDQQETTRFHLDGAPEESLLMLGYEPTRVPSELAMADYSRAAARLGLTPQQYLVAHNPMFRPGLERLTEHITHLDRADWSAPQILVVNNSSAPFDPGGRRPQGVMHQATIARPDPEQSRIINSTMLVVGEAGEPDPFMPARTEEFVQTARISPKLAY